MEIEKALVDSIKSDLFKNINAFINELGLSFDNIPNVSNMIPSIHKYIKTISKNESKFKTFVEDTYKHLNNFEKDFSLILFSKRKIKTEQYLFLLNIKIFNLNFDNFEKETKNTKKSIIKYIYNIYMSCSLLRSNSTEHLTNEFTSFISRIQQEIEDSNKQIILPTHKHDNVIDKPISTHIPDLSNLMSSMTGMSNMTGIPGMDNLMSSILGNKEILNIANEITEQMKNQNINPMSMLSSLMSGNIENSPLNNIVSQIQEKVESKINDGSINKSQLEEQANNIINTVNNEDITNNPIMNPMMSGMLKNLMKSMPKPPRTP